MPPSGFTDLIYAVDCAPGIELLRTDRVTNEVSIPDDSRKLCYTFKIVQSCGF